VIEENAMSKDAEALREQYGHWADHPEYPFADWQRETAEGDTRLGYWEWIAAQSNDDDPLTTVEALTCEDADRVLGLGDQFLEDWALDAVQNGSPDPDYVKRSAEWKALRPLFVAAPVLLNALRTIATLRVHPEHPLSRFSVETARIALEAIAAIR
jgi:hypothetical protein